ncbi:hypothetical protein [Streptomyces cavernicola]|uniref:Uncharacterized protein n=1 Tax=Streptomyces cavernicola TaxID=3043613 RepID=A0ABT6SJE1_9ACTN|nr:hypothetical protein [Streptomyces sp. B-S-A6]MDI3408317.1 hypothetical protein [Streptomyces sp. B-S-A6]
MKEAEEGGAKARVLAAALRNWAAIDASPGPTVARIVTREPPNWGYASTTEITNSQFQRLLQFFHDDLAEHRPGHSTPERAAAVIDALLTELAAAGRYFVTTADLTEAAPRIGRSRTWIATHISHLIDAGQLIETRRAGRFRIA